MKASIATIRMIVFCVSIIFLILIILLAKHSFTLLMFKMLGSCTLDHHGSRVSLFLLLQPCSRLLETKPLDLTNNTRIQFHFLYSCEAPPRKRDEGVLVDFSIDGGVTWGHITEMHFDLYRIST